MERNYTYSQCISRANTFMHEAFQYADKAAEYLNNSIYVKVAERHAQTAARWFELAKLAKHYGVIAAVERPFNAPIYVPAK